MDYQKARLLRACAAMLAVAACVALAHPGLGQTADPVIAGITVKGTRNLNQESVITSSGLKVGAALNQAALDDAKRRLLQTQLFGANRAEDPDAAVKVSATVDAAGAHVTIEVEENDVVKGVNITGSGPVPAKAIRDLMQTKEGFVLNLGTLGRDASAIQDYYASKGFMAMVSSDLAMPNGILEVPIIVAKVDEVKITGLHKTKPYVVTREMRLKKGEYYNSETFRKDYYRVFNTDLFADISPAIVAKSPGLVDP
ncbi:MAG: hypothetical protein FJX72_09300, partial [Armatimonadetes bacterium]|nr:hypothetical protein [Armatimonadota bacterium]